MKKIKYIALSVVLLCGLLSMVSRNNFIPEGLGFFGLDEEKTISAAQFRKFVHTDLVDAIVSCYTEAYPHAFMTKCYSDIEFEFNKNQWSEITEETLISTEHYQVGSIVFQDCGETHHVCSVKACYGTKDILVQESFMEEWQPKQQYLDAFCTKMKTLKEKTE